VADEVTVYLVGEQEAAATNVEVKLFSNGAWVKEADGTWTFRPFDVIRKITGFNRPV